MVTRLEFRVEPKDTPQDTLRFDVVREDVVGKEYLMQLANRREVDLLIPGLIKIAEAGNFVKILDEPYPMGGRRIRFEKLEAS